MDTPERGLRGDPVDRDGQIAGTRDQHKPCADLSTLRREADQPAVMNTTICDHGKLQRQCETCQLRAEVERLKTCSTIEVMCENPSVDAHVREWEARCLKAEASLLALRGYVQHKDGCGYMLTGGQLVHNGMLQAQEKPIAHVKACTCGLAGLL